ncbi:MAG: hypothetical protein GY701_00655 [Sulfitobacter sp.]|nr:hypothetical protein [Sulfitobacter sp.]
MSSGEAAEVLSLTSGRIRQLGRDGQFGATKSGSAWTFDRDQVLAHVAERSGSDELAGLRFENRLLAAENTAQRHKFEVELFQAQLAERDATIAVLSKEILEAKAKVRALLGALDGLQGALRAGVDQD